MLFSELGKNLFLDGLITQGGLTRQGIDPSALAFLVSTGGSFKMSPRLPGGTAAVGVAFLPGLAAFKKRRGSQWAKESADRNPTSFWESILH